MLPTLGEIKIPLDDKFREQKLKIIARKLEKRKEAALKGEERIFGYSPDLESPRKPNKEISSEIYKLHCELPIEEICEPPIQEIYEPHFEPPSEPHYEPHFEPHFEPPSEEIISPGSE